MDIWSTGIILLELISGVLFAPGAHTSKNPVNSLLAAIDGVAGPLSSESWPGLETCPGWFSGRATLAKARKGKEQCPDPFANPRRPLNASARGLATRDHPSPPSVDSRRWGGVNGFGGNRVLIKIPHDNGQKNWYSAKLVSPLLRPVPQRKHQCS